MGGIFTVIKTKAQVSKSELGPQYTLIGPLKDQYVRTEVELKEPEDWILPIP